jgi:hypothetical protein
VPVQISSLLEPYQRFRLFAINFCYTVLNKVLINRTYSESQNMSFDVSMMVKIHILAFHFTTRYNLVDFITVSEKPPPPSLVDLKMEAACPSEKLVTACQTTWSHSAKYHNMDIRIL